MTQLLDLPLDILDVILWRHCVGINFTSCDVQLDYRRIGKTVRNCVGKIDH